MTGTVIQLPSAPARVLTKKQLAAELGRSMRWIELRMREGLPTLPRRTPAEHARFDLDEVRAWLEMSARRAQPPLEERVARLERQVTTLVAVLNREGA